MTMEREPLEPLPPDVQAVLEAGRVGASPDAETRARLLRRVAATAGLATAGAAGASAAQATPIASATGGAVRAGVLAAKPLAIAVAFALGAAAGVGAHVAWRARRAPVPTHDRHASQPAIAVSAPAPIAIPVPVPVVVPIPVRAPAPPPAAAPPPRRPVSPRPAASNLATESALVERARTALGRGDATAALAAVDEHARRFPQGTMTEERDAVRIQALALAGRRDEARLRARDFRARFPHSLSGPVIDQVVGE